MLGSIFVINDMFFSIRLQEMEFKLIDYRNSSKNIDHMALVASYNLQKMRYENLISNDKADLQEVLIRSMMQKKDEAKIIKSDRYGIFLKPALFYMNIMRSLLGKDKIKTVTKNQRGNFELDYAYYLERNLIFKKSIDNYNYAMKKSEFMENVRVGIQLHQGYCHALSGNYKEAKRKYNKIIKNYGNKEIGITATLLLWYLEKFEKEQKRIIANNDSDYIKSTKLLNLMAYDKALALLEKIEYSSSKKSLLQIRYYKALCFEKLGKKNRAVEIYINLITSQPQSEFSKSANRRLYMISHFSQKDPKLKYISKKINLRYNDTVLNEIMKVKKITNPELRNQKDIEVINPKLLKKAETFIASFENKKQDRNGNIMTGNVIINMKNGDVLVGLVIKSVNNKITLKTSIGIISINKSDVLTFKKKR